MADGVPMVVQSGVVTPTDLAVALEIRPHSRTGLIDRFPSYGRAVLTATVFCAPLAMHLGGRDLLGVVKLTVLWWGGLTALALWFISALYSREWPPRSRIGLASLGFLLACLVSTVLSKNPGRSLVGETSRTPGFAVIVLWVGIMFAVIGLYWKEPQRLRQLTIAASAAAAFLSLYIVAQQVGVDAVKWIDPATRRAPTYPGGMMGNSNFAGAYLGITLPLSIYLIATARTIRRSRLMSMLFGLDLVALWLTQTRGGMLASVVSVVAMAACCRPRLARRTKVAAAALLVVIGVAAGVSVWRPSALRSAALSDVHVFSASTLEYRSFYWASAVRIFLDHPLVGTGVSTFYAEYPAYRLAADGERAGRRLADRPHNIFLEYAADTGILGFGTFVLVVALAVRYGLRRCRRIAGEQRLLLAALVGSLAGYLGQGVFSLDIPPLPAMAWIAVAGIAVLADPVAVLTRERLAQRHDVSNAAESLGGRGPRVGRGEWMVRAVVACVLAVLVVMGVRPLRATVAAGRGDFAAAMRLDPVNSDYPAAAGEEARSLAVASRDRDETIRGLRRAQAHFERALRLRPGTVDYVYQIARTNSIWAQSIDPAQFLVADRWWQKALQMDPQNPVLRGQYEEAVDAQRYLADNLQAIAHARPGDVGPLVAVAQAYVGLGEPDRARAALSSALQIDPASPDALGLLGTIGTGS